MKVLRKNGEIVEVNFEDQEGKKAFWHTSAHVLAQAVKRLYPETKCAIGPAIENGFYYDFDFAFSFSEEHLKAIEEEMRKIVKESLLLQVLEKSKEEALSFMNRMLQRKLVFISRENMRNFVRDHISLTYVRLRLSKFCQ